jgi:hypothetical protein
MSLERSALVADPKAGSRRSGARRAREASAVVDAAARPRRGALVRSLSGEAVVSAADPLFAATQPALTPDEATLRDELWSVLPEWLGPLAAEADQSDVTNRELVAVLRELGLFRHFLPSSHGGLGLSITKICLIREALAYQSVAADEFFASVGAAAVGMAQRALERRSTTCASAMRSGSGWATSRSCSSGWPSWPPRSPPAVQGRPGVAHLRGGKRDHEVGDRPLTARVTVVPGKGSRKGRSNQCLAVRSARM